jgi:uncharacterized repeat protein (TIGR03803 family)
METRLSPARLALAVVMLTVIWSLGVQAQTYTLIYNFGSSGAADGRGPVAPLIFDPQGNLYGTTLQGGAAGFGSVFKLAPNGNGSWTESVIYSFPADGDQQYSPVALDVRGNLYGETPGDGNQSQGSVYELSPNGNGNWSIQTLHSFTGYPDGDAPTGGVLLGNANQVYGVANAGGMRNIGMVFNLDHLSAAGWHEFTLHSFLGGSDGEYPGGPLAIDAAGNLYGVTNGGSGGNAIVYKLTPNQRSFGWSESILYTFQNPYGTPNGGLIFDASGNIYGTDREDGPYYVGTVWKLSPNPDGNYTFTPLYSFTGVNGDGAYLNGPLVMDASGNLYGTTEQGGRLDGYYCMYGGCGTIFKLTPSSNGQWTETILYDFNDTSSGWQPHDGLIMDRAGNLYGTALYGGATGAGTVFELTP